MSLAEGIRIPYYQWLKKSGFILFHGKNLEVLDVVIKLAA